MAQVLFDEEHKENFVIAHSAVVSAMEVLLKVIENTAKQDSKNVDEIHREVL